MASASLRLEAIGDAFVARRPKFGRFGWDHHNRRPWVAEVFLGRNHVMYRRYLRGIRDYSESYGNGNRDVNWCYILEPQRVYKVHKLLSWKKHREYFCGVVHGEIVELSEDEAWEILEWELKRRSDSMSSSHPRGE